MVGILFYLIRRIGIRNLIEDWKPNIKPHKFSHLELKRATNGFREKELFGVMGSSKCILRLYQALGLRWQ